MEKKNILISLDILDIGGVETFVYNQSLAMKKKGYNVHILAKKGVYTEILEKKGIHFIEFEFTDKIYYDFEKVKEILEIFEKYNIKEVHINQFPAMNVLLPACLIANIPYIVYLHMGSSLIDNEKLNAYNYFERQFCTYKQNFKLLFKYAHKIIAVTPEIREYTIKRYEIDEIDKCIVMPNSINFDLHDSKTKVTGITRVLIVSRLSHDKLDIIFNGIKLYQKIKEKSKGKITLTIVGDGKEKETVQKYVEDNKIQDVIFKGRTSNISSALEENDLLIGVGRCVLEALTMKRLAIISGYTGLKCLLKGELTKKEIDENFTGKNLKNISPEELADEIISLDSKKIEQIVEENYKQIREQLDIDNNIYIAAIEKFKYNIDIESLIKTMTEINSIIGKREEQAREKIESNWKEHVEYKEWVERQLEYVKKKNKNMENEIKELTSQISKIQKSILYRAKRILKGGK